MLSLGAIGFAAPLALAALASLPVLYLLLRATPPAPRRTAFPPFRLLMDTEQDEETPRRTPLWLVILRLLIAALVIFGLSRPILFPRAEGPERPLLLVIDDDWAAAPNWARIRDEGLARIDSAVRAGEDVTLVFTAPRIDDLTVAAIEAADARRRLAAHEPAPWPADRLAAAEALAGADISSGQEAIYLTNGIGGPGAEDLLAAMRSHGALGQARTLVPDARNAPLALRPPRPDASGFAAQIVRAEGTGARTGEIVALSADGRLVARAGFAFAEGETVAAAAMSLPPELRRRAALMRVSTAPSAGASIAAGDAWRHPSIGIVEDGAADAQPLLSDIYYLERALAPSADVQRGRLGEFLERRPGMIALVDGAGRGDPEALLHYVREGGVVLRFAGPLLSAGQDPLLPVRLREGGRDFGGALVWGEPQRLAAFPRSGPFSGLTTLDEVTVERQVLAEPTADLAERTWARLQDGTPLVTARREGQGWIVLFHVTAGPSWSSLPLSGLFPEMLERVAAYAEGGGDAAGDAGGPYAPDRMLTAAGLLAAPPPEAESIPAADWAAAAPGPRTPAGLYRRGAALEGLNIADASFALQRFPRVSGVATAPYGERIPRAIAGSLLLAALILLAVDAVVALILSGRMRNLTRRLRGALGAARSGRVAASLAALLALGIAAPDPARAQGAPGDGAAPPGAYEISLAYVRTGDPRIDNMSYSGLNGLSYQLTLRTAVEPENPVGLNLETDDLIFFPLIYWPIAPDSEPLSALAAERLSAYVRAGGTVLVDTQDAGSRVLDEAGSMRRALRGLDIPPLHQAPADHVLTKAFFLLDTFPGRWSEGRVWVESAPTSAARDGVSGWVIGGNDWAAAWAVDDQGRPLAALPGADQRQREMAYRFGINLVMYVLTGNYKSDQVHVPDLLQRLGQ